MLRSLVRLFAKPSFTQIMDADKRALLASVIGLTEAKLAETAKNKALTQNLLSVAQLASGLPGFTPSKDTGKLLYTLGSSAPETIDQFRPLLVEYIVSGKFLNVRQLEAGVDYLKKQQAYDQAVFDEQTGVGVVVTEEQITAAVETVFTRDEEFVRAQGWASKGLPNAMVQRVRELVKWGNPASIKEKVDAKLLAVLGPKSEAVEQKPKKPKAEVKSVEDARKEKISSLMARDLKSTLNPPEIMAKHLAFTGGKYFTRFPPEPNGYLHIGHAKAMRFSFKVAEETGGHCYLRYDDTNPEKETHEYIENIEKNVAWLGYTPYKITFASDYSQEMYECAVELIRRGKAYVDEQPAAVIKAQRREMTESPFRNTSVEENLAKFERMRRGYYEEKEACLRMKIDMKHDNPCMRDTVAYRIKYVPHPHVGDAWCIYPTYDMEHCIVDSIENITHSLCTLEFEIRRDSYYWLLEALDLYRPFVWEYSRLNITHTVMSKRRLQTMVRDGIVVGWDDPRIPTINGLRRRGYTPKAINDFVDEVGVTRRGNDKFVSYQLLESFARKDLNSTAKRTMAVLDPLKVTLVNFTETQRLSVPYFPNEPEKGVHEITISSVFYIENSDFRSEASDEFFGLTPGKVVGLKYCPFKVKCLEVLRNEAGQPTELRCEVVDSNIKTKGILHWLSTEDAAPAEVRLYNLLFLSENPNSLEKWIDDINPQSLEVKPNALVNRNLLSNLQNEEKFQFERMGYFVVDKDSTPERPVFNRTVTLQEGKKKDV